MGILADTAKARSPFFKLGPGEKTSAVYKGFKMVPDTFNPGNPDKFRFMLEIDGNVKYWDTGSNSVAMMMDSVSEGEIIEIQNTGTDPKKPKWNIVPMVSMSEGEKAEQQKLDKKPK